MSWLDDLVATAHSQLGEREREALWTRGVSDPQIDLFQIGYLDGRTPPGMPEDFVRWCRGGSTLEDVFVLPLTNVLGKIKGVQFRHVDRDARGYRTYYPDRDESVYFGLGQAIPSMWATRKAFVVEGGFDVFPVQRIFPNTFAALTLGTSEALAALLRRFVDQVWLVYDNDYNGRKACLKFKEEHSSEKLDVRIPTLPSIEIRQGKYAKDPGEIWEAWGDDLFRDYLVRQVGPHQEKPHVQNLQ